MAAVCFGPPPLPPNKKSLLIRHHGGSSTRCRKPPHATIHHPNANPLSSTYRSFRDPADDPMIISSMAQSCCDQLPAASPSPSKRWSRHASSAGEKQSNSRRRRKRQLSTAEEFSFEEESTAVPVIRGGMFRSQSEGNLQVKHEQEEEHRPMTINRYIKVLSGSWKNLLNLGGMSRPPKPAATAKKVAPPAVPHEFRHSGSSFGSAGYASSEDAVFLAPSSEPPGGPRDDHSDYGGSTVSGSTGKSPGPVMPAPTFSFPPSGGVGQQGGGVGGGVGGPPPPPSAGDRHLLTHKAAVYYHHQLSLQEDQGIDMTQSPGRDSPGSSSGSAGSGSRHSTASLDSGRASYHPLSTAGRSTIGSSNSPRCSLSSCSIGSEQGRIERMINQGLPEQEIIHAWLVDLQYDEYFTLFLTAGYDLPTIGRMTPEDLTAIGIKKPNHRKRLKAEIALLNLPDNLPDYIPGSLEEWLSLLRLEEYQPAFLEQGYHTVDDVAQLQWEDLEEFGIVKLGHQKKIILAIKRIKDIRAGKRFNTAEMNRSYTQQDVVVHAPLGGPPPPSSPSNVAIVTGGGNTNQATGGMLPAVHSTFRSFHQQWELDQTRQLAAAGGGGGGGGGGGCGNYLTPEQQLQHQSIYCTDIVPIKIRTVRGKSLESLEDPTERTHHTFSADNTQTFYYHHHPQHHPHLLPAHHHPHHASSQQQQQQQQQSHHHLHQGGGHPQQQQMAWRPRSYDDGDITPTNETGLLLYEGCGMGGMGMCMGVGQGGGTLPRPRCGVIKQRPIAKITANSRDSFSGVSAGEFEKGSQGGATVQFTAHHYKTLPRDLMEAGYHMGHQQHHMHLQHQQQYAGSPVLGKKLPPNPPKRHDSCSSESSLNDTCPSTGATPTTTTTTVEIHQVQTSSPLPLPAYPSSDSLSISLDGDDGPTGAAASGRRCMVTQRHEDEDGELPLPPPPAPGTPPGVAAAAAAAAVAGGGSMNSSRSWGAEEQELINSLALQHRNGSDASFKSSSSAESDSLPFANENAGTIRTRAGIGGTTTASNNPNTTHRSNSLTGCPSPTPNSASVAKTRSSLTGLPPHPSSNNSSMTVLRQQQQQANITTGSDITNTSEQPSDVLNDIGNMLANLTDELDAMLEEEKRLELQQQQQLGE